MLSIARCSNNWIRKAFVAKQNAAELRNEVSLVGHATDVISPPPRRSFHASADAESFSRAWEKKEITESSQFRLTAMGTSHKDLKMLFILFLNTFRVEEHTSDSDFSRFAEFLRIYLCSPKRSTFGVWNGLLRANIFLSPDSLLLWEINRSKKEISQNKSRIYGTRH